mgnify:FL=1
MFFNINTDTNKKISSRLLWLIDCFIDNLNPSLPTDSDIKIIPFGKGKNKNTLDVVRGDFHTPSRVLSNIFWSYIDWDRLNKCFDKGISVLDVGCGTGNYSDFFYQVSGGVVSKYSGIDIFEHEDWKNKYARENFSFSVGSVDNIKKIYNNEDMVLSQSVLEHVENDKKLIDSMSSIVEKQNKRIIQIHLVPSSTCLYKYLWHGYRQYTPKKIDLLLKDVKNAKKYLVPLGGKGCNSVHIKWITIPEILSRIIPFRIENSKNNNSKYTKERDGAIIFDGERNLDATKASFYAIIIDHNFNNQEKSSFIL